MPIQSNSISNLSRLYPYFRTKFLYLLLIFYVLETFLCQLCPKFVSAARNCSKWPSTSPNITNCFFVENGRNTDKKMALPEPPHQINNGYALAIHNKYFNNLPSREGSEKDLYAITIFYKEAGLDLDIIENVDVKEIRAHCRKVSQDATSFQKYDGSVCFVLR